MTVVIGDVVASREHRTRRAMRSHLRNCLALANERVPHLQPLTPTVGDEFQGIYANVAHAIDATLQVRASALPDLDVRFGVATGTLDTFDPDRAPFGQDGPAWWSARAAIEQAAEGEDARGTPRGWRTRYAAAGPPPAGDDTPIRFVDLVNAFLACRDEIVWRMDGADLRILRAALGGPQSQESIAAGIGATQSAVSQRMVRNGHHALLMARQLLGDPA